MARCSSCGGEFEGQRQETCPLCGAERPRPKLRRDPGVGATTAPGMAPRSGAPMQPPPPPPASGFETLTVMKRGGIAASQLLVFADAFVDLPGSKAAAGGMMFGAVGGIASFALAKRARDKNQSAIAEKGAMTPEGVVAAVPRARIIRFNTISEVRIEDGIGRAFKMTIQVAGGKKELYRFADKDNPVIAVAHMLMRGLGQRFVDATK